MISVYNVLILSILLRVGFFFFGLYQDAYMTVRYTDIDYLVFSDAAMFVFNGGSPYKRETYRYTPLLAWMLLPNCWGGYWYHFGKVLFMACDLVTGFFIIRLLQSVVVGGKPLSSKRVVILSSLWLLNPIVITISTRGSSESVLTVMVMASLYFLICKKSVVGSALFLGLATHFKMYPLIYIPSIMFYLSSQGTPLINLPVIRWVNVSNIKFFVVTSLTVGILSYIMYGFYGHEFLFNSYLYHFGRVDHRHNFSVYNTALYYKSALPDIPPIQEYAFLPQVVLALVIPLVYGKRDIISTLFLQTFAFVTFNKVITSQYFIWFLIMLPHFLANSNLARWYKGPRIFLQWGLTQGLWLKQAYDLEFLGKNTFIPLLVCSIIFFLSNCAILCEFIDDLEQRPPLMLV